MRCRLDTSEKDSPHSYSGILRQLNEFSLALMSIAIYVIEPL